MKIWRERHTWTAGDAVKKLAGIDINKVKNIAIIKHAAFGDLLCTRPFLVTLRNYFPNANLTFCAISHYTRGIPDDLVDRVFITPGKNKKSGLWSKMQEFRQLGKQDLIFDLTNSTPSFLITLLNHAGFKIGFQHRFIHKLVYDVAIPRAEFRFEAETFLEQLNILGLQYELPLRYAFPVTALHRPKPYVIYFPTASARNKSWPIENFIELIDQMAVRFPDLDHILLSGLADWEIELAKHAASALSQHSNVIKLAAGKEDAALIKGARALVANDTGIRHLAIAVETPTVGIFFHATPFGYWPRFGQHEVVFEIDGRIPSVDSAKQALCRILTTD